MTSGKIVGLARVIAQDRALFHVEQNEKRTCVVRAICRREDNQQPIEPQLGDHVWWRETTLFWTPRTCLRRLPERCGQDWDVRLPLLSVELQPELVTEAAPPTPPAPPASSPSDHPAP